MDYIITTEQLTKKYKNFTSVNNVSLHIQKGSIYGFLGPNGAGKSTTMKMLLGLTAPTKGSFTIDGKHFPDDRIAILKEIGSFIESPSFYANLTGRENLDIIRRILGLPKDAVEDALDLVGLTEFGGRLAKKYSLGMKQRLGLAGALLGRPPILILDEPTNHLDITSKEILEDALNGYTGTVLFVSHDRYFINRTATRILDLTEQTVVNYIGNYDYYLEKRDVQMQGIAASKGSAPAEEKNSAAKLDWKQKKEEQETMEIKPYVISPEEFGEFEDYERISLSYYADQILADEDDEKVEDVDNVVGLESLTHFGEFEDDSVFVRNDRLKCDYEILLDQRTYSDVMKQRPHQMEV